MALVETCIGLVLIGIALQDAFETIVLPRRVSRRFRVTSLFYLYTWNAWAAAAKRIRQEDRREGFLSFYGPLSLLLLLVVWATLMILGYALLYRALGAAINTPDGTHPFGTYVYMSGSTLFTLGIGDITPRSGVGRALTVLEAGNGLAFFALVIGYLPVLYQAFSRREVSISMLDARAGSPPTAEELLRRHAKCHQGDGIVQFMTDWERWAAELMESHLSYPVLSFYRSQHDNQSWLGALTTVLDASTLVIVGIEGVPVWPARLTFAMARHASVDLSQSLRIQRAPPTSNRLTDTALARLRADLAAVGMQLRDGPDADQQLAELRAMYEPYVNAIAQRLLVPLPAWQVEGKQVDDWETSVWEHASTTHTIEATR